MYVDMVISLLSAAKAAQEWNTEIPITPAEIQGWIELLKLAKDEK